MVNEDKGQQGKEYTGWCGYQREEGLMIRVWDCRSLDIRRVKVLTKRMSLAVNRKTSFPKIKAESELRKLISAVVLCRSSGRLHKISENGNREIGNIRRRTDAWAV